jgi:hypothetical protein
MFPLAWFCFWVAKSVFNPYAVLNLVSLELKAGLPLCIRDRYVYRHLDLTLRRNSIRVGKTESPDKL